MSSAVEQPSQRPGALDFFSAVRVDDPTFQRLVLGVDEAVRDNFAALLVDERARSRQIVVFSDASALGEELQDLAYFLDDMLAFAFDEAPADTIERWAQRYSPDLKEKAVQRVRFMQDKMPNVQRVWKQKSSAILPTLAFMRSTAVGDGPGQVLVELQAALAGQFGRPLTTATRSFLVELLPSDIAALQEFLGELLDSMEAEANTG